jgi:transposase InsO family protein
VSDRPDSAPLPDGLDLPATDWQANQRRAERVHQAVSRALWQRPPTAGLIMPTDRGRQYGADRYRQILPQHGMPSSMSRQGTCWDNAVAERFGSGL